MYSRRRLRYLYAVPCLLSRTLCASWWSLTSSRGTYRTSPRRSSSARQVGHSRPVPSVPASSCGPSALPDLSNCGGLDLRPCCLFLAFWQLRSGTGDVDLLVHRRPPGLSRRSAGTLSCGAADCWRRLPNPNISPNISPICHGYRYLVKSSGICRTRAYRRRDRTDRTASASAPDRTAPRRL